MNARIRRAALRLLRPAHRAERGSMPLALLVTVVGLLLSAAVLPVAVNQIAGTGTVSGRTQELQAAQAGIDVALGQLRVATATDGKGDLEKLPCTMTGALGVGDWGYRVTITYFKLGATTEPVPQTCPPAAVPVTAQLTATGGHGTTPAEGAPQTRTVEATYTFKTNNENITGGAIVLAEPTVNPLCLDAGSDASPAAGTVVRVQRCKATGNSDQRFAYTSDLNIKLVGSETASAPTGMCLDVPYPRANGNQVTFQKCLGLVSRQQWSLNNNGNFASTRETTPVIGDFCFNLQTAGTAGSEIVLGACGGGGNVRVFRPRPEAGAGMASANTGQLVNYRQFSRCLDVTNHDPGWSYMIVWFCKQAPDGNVSWNQKWVIPAQITADTPEADRTPATIWTTDYNGVRRCLRSPGSTAATAYVTVAACSISDPNQLWRVYGDTDVYATSYRIQDTFGYCLTPTDLTMTPRDTHPDGTAKTKVAPCDSSELQKWNAPANLNEPLALTKTREK
jgi:hypothetical protein